MFDIGWQELLLIGIVALVVVGPKDLPKVLRTTARVVQKARAMSREFQASLAEMAREAELDEIKRKVEDSARFDLGDELRKSVDPTGKLSADFDPTEFNRQLKDSVERGPPHRAEPSIERSLAGQPRAHAAAPLPSSRPAEPAVTGNADTSAGAEMTPSTDHAPPTPPDETVDKGPR